MNSFNFFSNNLVISRCKNFSDQRKLFAKINTNDKFEKFIYQSLLTNITIMFLKTLKRSMKI